jgi:SAM-dependent methyltransferase
MVPHAIGHASTHTPERQRESDIMSYDTTAQSDDAVSRSSRYDEHALIDPIRSADALEETQPDPGAPSDRALRVRPDRLGSPKHAKDGLSFDELARSYNFQDTCGFHELFARLMVSELRRYRAERGGPIRAVNIGCGTGIGRNADFLAAVNDEIDEHWGVEPDDSIEAPAMFDRFQHALAETADLPEASFDVVYSTMVVEHVAEPDRFMEAVARCLKPGGLHIFMTVNGRHYFARASWLMNRVGVEDAVLRVVRGKSQVEGYHYPVQYRMNKPGQIAKLADAHGFLPPTNVFVENEGPRPYFPGPMRLIYNAMQAKRRRFHNPESLLTLISRMERR